MEVAGQMLNGRRPCGRPGSVWRGPFSGQRMKMLDAAVLLGQVAHGEEIGTEMIVLGVILLIIGLLAGISLLTTVGGILVVVGAILWILGASGRMVGGRKHYF